MKPPTPTLTRNNRPFLGIGILLTAFLVLVHLFDLGAAAEHKALDIFRATHTPHPEIVIAAIDNESIQDIGRFPWDRGVYGQFLDNLGAQYNPRLVVFDINFSEQQNELQDSLFRSSLEKSTFPVILAAQAVYEKGGENPARILAPLHLQPTVGGVTIGLVNVPASNDGIVRKFPTPIRFEGRAILPLSMEAARISGNFDVPQNNGAFIDYAGGAGTFRTIPFSSILDGTVDPSLLEDSIILVGATASDLRDYLYAPVPGGILAGVEWHANVLDNLLLNRNIRPVPLFIVILAGIIFSLIITLIPFSVKNRYATIVFGVGLVALPSTSFVLWRSGWAFPFLINLAGLVSIFAARSAYVWYQAEVEKRKLQKTIQNRFSPQVIEAIMRDPKLLRLGGERKEVTMLFSDIRNFTTISEEVAPETLSTLLHEYFTEMTEEVLATSGVLDKFIGDAVMAFWGAPLEQIDQADRAVQTALGMLKRLKKLQEKWAAQKLPFIDIGIGIHTGIATVGNMGSEKRFDYTVIGDTVNTASRLEGLNKEYKTHLIVSQATLNRLTIPIKSRGLGEVLVKGKTKSLNIFEIVSE